MKKRTKLDHIADGDNADGRGVELVDDKDAVRLLLGEDLDNDVNGRVNAHGDGLAPGLAGLLGDGARALDKVHGGEVVHFGVGGAHLVQEENVLVGDGGR